ncbi:hypothetical protein HOLleu_40426 [Holothuria leucospilota]|uniref:Uncharacterized protein n=1 Tax=Holothuria leucospilota TaxID=206669 RepID=A0A9Q1BCU8_HOLLE|nr:hypothetical protein HOLleu_40426 [Holothuria leucospilota]
MIIELLPKNSKLYFMRFYMHVFKEQERGGIPLPGRRQRRVQAPAITLRGMSACLVYEMNALVLDPGVLALRTIHEIFGMRGNPEPNRGMRHAAYRQFIMWQYDRMGQHNRQLSHSQLLCS